MEIIKLGKSSSERDVLLESVLRYCHHREGGYELCRGARKYRMITEWTQSELREAFRLIGGKE